jgi:hypothetical protein
LLFVVVVVVVLFLLSVCLFVFLSFISQSSLSVTAYSKNLLVNAHKSERGIDKGQHSHRYGGLSDFKLAEWIVIMYQMQQDLGVKLVQVVLASISIMVMGYATSPSHRQTEN